MAIQVSINVRDNTLTNEKIASARIVGLQTVSFDSFCEYLAQDSIVGPAAVAAVMKQFQTKVPYLLALGNKIEFDSTGSTITPTISGSLSQSTLTARLTAAGKEDRDIEASDLTVAMLTAGFEFKVSNKFKAGFQPDLIRKSSTSATSDDDNDDDSASSGSSTDTSGNKGGLPSE